MYLNDGDGRCLATTASFYVLGIGSEFLMGAMAAGATAVRTVEMAIDYIMGCGGNVQKLSIDDYESA